MLAVSEVCTVDGWQQVKKSDEREMRMRKSDTHSSHSDSTASL